MATLNFVDVEKMEVLPSNQPSDNTYSFKKGNPIITLEIAPQSKLLKPSTLRINGKLTIRDANGYIAQNNGLIQAGNGRGEAPAPVGASAIKLNSRVGVNSVFQNVVIASNQTNQTLESVRQYGRMCATILEGTHSQDDFMSNRGVQALNPSLDSAGANLNNNQVDFSVRLYAGMFMGGNGIPLGVNGVRGLTISLELASDQMVLTGAQAGGGGAYYELSDLSLTADLLIPDAEGQQKLSVPGTGEFTYNSYNSLYSVINSSDATQTYNLSQNNVLNVFHNFLPVSWANNYSQDSFSTSMLKNTDPTGVAYSGDVVLKRVAFSRGGLRLGLDYDLDVATQSAEARPETGVLINGLNSLKPLYDLTKSLNQKQLIGYGGNDLKPYADADEPVQQLVEANVGERNFMVGLALDNASGVGMSFRGQAYATRIQSTLDGKSPNSVYTYVLGRNTLIYSPQGIMVQS